MGLNIRIGHGYDVHAFEQGDHLILGGVKIPHSSQFKAHSDGDVLLHAISDALLGAAALGDIGRHFPDTDEAFAGADSRILLRSVVEMIHAKGYLVGNVDATIIAQKPKLANHISSMVRHLSEDLNIPLTAINIKATTTEKLGFAGREEGVAAHAVCLLEIVATA